MLNDIINVTPGENIEVINTTETIEVINTSETLEVDNSSDEITVVSSDAVNVINEAETINVVSSNETIKIFQNVISTVTASYVEADSLFSLNGSGSDTGFKYGSISGCIEFYISGVLIHKMCPIGSGGTPF